MDLLSSLFDPPHVAVHRQVMAKVQQMQSAEAKVREQALLSGAMPAEFRVFITMDRSNPCNTRYGAVLG